MEGLVGAAVRLRRAVHTVVDYVQDRPAGHDATPVVDVGCRFVEELASIQAAIADPDVLRNGGQQVMSQCSSDRGRRAKFGATDFLRQ
jgi:hypothetical protein